MIEHINTTDNEKVGSGEINRLIRLPKNIRQIGQADTDKRIYIEDYVVTFIRQRGTDNRYVLLGSSGMVGEVHAVFISGAIVINPKWDESNKCHGFLSSTWECIYKEIKENFPRHDIMGWAIGTKDWDESDNSVLKSHIANFPGEDKVLYVLDMYSREEYMYKYCLGALKKQSGYYMYYEKNEEMQAYMLKVNKPKGVDANYKDETTDKIRTIALKGYPSKQEGKLEESKEKGHAVLTTVLAVAMLALAFKISVDGSQLFSKEEPVATLAVNGQVVEANKEMTLPPKVETDEIEEEMKKPTSEEKQENVKENTEKTSKPKETTKPVKTKKPSATKEVITTKGPEAAVETQTDNSERTYTVAKGDTLVNISYKMYGTIFRVEDIMKANKITDKNMIVVGQKLLIPQ